MCLKFVNLFLLIFGVIIYSNLEITNAEDRKWVWKDNNRHYTDLDPELSARYEVYEGDRPYKNPSTPIRPPIGFVNRPNQQPSNLFTNRYPQKRPGGNYGANYAENTAILTGPIPSWVQQGPLKNFDRCKCTESFNCNSPGISYGHCDAGKKYCCYSTKKINQIGEPLPSRPIHTPEAGILAGPGGPIDIPPQRPLGIGGNLSQRPFPPPQRPLGPIVGPQRPLGLRPNAAYGRPSTQHTYEEGILVGPDGPYDRHPI